MQEQMKTIIYIVFFYFVLREEKLRKIINFNYLKFFGGLTQWKSSIKQ